MAVAGGRPGDGDGGPSTDAELARRLDRLSRELKVEQAERAATERLPRTGATDYGRAFRMASEFVAGVVVGALIGWGLDAVAGTSPWGLIGFLLLGFAAGVLNVVRTASQMADAVTRKRPEDGGVR
jgi:ATP synthase protein I